MSHFEKGPYWPFSEIGPWSETYLAIVKHDIIFISKHQPDWSAARSFIKTRYFYFGTYPASTPSSGCSPLSPSLTSNYFQPSSLMITHFSIESSELSSLSELSWLTFVMFIIVSIFSISYKIRAAWWAIPIFQSDNKVRCPKTHWLCDHDHTSLDLPPPSLFLPACLRFCVFFFASFFSNETVFCTIFGPMRVKSWDR